MRNLLLAALLASAMIFGGCQATDPTPGGSPGDDDTVGADDDDTGNPGEVTYVLDLGYNTHDGSRVSVNPAEVIVFAHWKVGTGEMHPVDEDGDGVFTWDDQADTWAITVEYRDELMGEMVHREVHLDPTDPTAVVDFNVNATGTWTCETPDAPTSPLAGTHEAFMYAGYILKGIAGDVEVNGCSTPIGNFEDANTFSGYDESVWSSFVCTR